MDDVDNVADVADSKRIPLYGLLLPIFTLELELSYSAHLKVDVTVPRRTQAYRIVEGDERRITYQTIGRTVVSNVPSSKPRDDS